MYYTQRYKMEISLHCFNIGNYNAKILLIAAVILHELVHVFEPQEVDLEEQEKLFCKVFYAEGLSTDPAKITFKQGEIFETMFFGGVAERFERNDILWGGYAQPTNESHFRIDDDNQYHQFFVTSDLKIIRNILKRKKRTIVIRQFLRSIRQRVINITGTFRQRLNI